MGAAEARVRIGATQPKVPDESDFGRQEWCAIGVKDSKLKFQLVDPDDIKTVVSTKYAIEDYLVLNESTFVFGPPKHLKTFLVLSWLLCIATGLDWFGHKVRRLKV